MGRKHHRIARKGDMSFVVDKSDLYTKPGMICPVVRYAPNPATMPSMASLPLIVSATFFCGSIGFGGVIRRYLELLVLLLRMHRLLLQRLALLPNH